jgi:RNA-directed DNA polymerase
MTRGTNKEDTPDGMDMERLNYIKKKILENEFEWGTIKRIEIPKPGSNKKRPLGIPNFTDKLVQEAIRLVLNTIYEPVFQKYELNFGFRPNRSTKTAMTKIQNERQGMTTAIEGDIKGAYDNVDFKIMRNILEKKIGDKKLLDLIEKSFKVGIQLGDQIQISEKGVPQGGILSPLLFNIYMHEFDLAVIQICKETLERKNIEEKRVENPKTKAYNRIVTKNSSLVKEMKKLIDPTTKRKSNLKEFNEIKELWRKSRAKTRKTKTVNQTRKLLMFSYTRYADDWLIMTNANEKTCGEIKKIIATWLQEKLRLELSEEKTKITVIIKEAITFLGFSIC